MPCASTLYLDLETDAAVRGAWQAIADAGLSTTMIDLGYRPHLTLSVCDQLDLENSRDELAASLAVMPPLPLTFTHLGTFLQGGVVFLGVTVNQRLIDVHRQIWQLLEKYMKDPLAYYAPGLWVPHVTLGYGLDIAQTGQVVDVLLKNKLPIHGMATEFVVTDVKDSCYTDLFSRQLTAQ